MDSAITLEKQPAILPLYLACLLKKVQNQTQSDVINELNLNFNDCQIDGKKLKKFKQFYGLSSHSKHVPASYVHLLVFRPQLKFLLNETLPFPVMGLVHMFNDIVMHDQISINDKININISVKEFKDGNKGKELTLHTKVTKQGKLVWESLSGYLYPKKSKLNKPTNVKPQTQKAASELKLDWNLPTNLGRKFALLSGDANPIHTYKLAAKLFGFKQAIAHGMCMALKCESELSKLRESNKPLKRLYVEFKKPIFLPNNVTFNVDNLNDSSVDFLVTTNNGKYKVMLNGFADY